MFQSDLTQPCIPVSSILSKYIKFDRKDVMRTYFQILKRNIFLLKNQPKKRKIYKKYVN